MTILLFMIVKRDCKNLFLLLKDLTVHVSRPKRPIPSKKYGCDMIRFTRSGDQALHCSMKVDGNRSSIGSLYSLERIF